MGSGLEMKEMDLIELYQLLSLYRRTYEEEEVKSLTELLERVGGRYRKRSGGKDIIQARNPREAGRKRKYTEKEDARIKEIYQSGKSMRETAKEAGCSVGHVQDVLKKGVEGSGVYGN